MKGKKGIEVKLKNETTIIWPGDRKERPEGYVTPTELKVCGVIPYVILYVIPYVIHYQKNI